MSAPVLDLLTLLRAEEDARLAVSTRRKPKAFVLTSGRRERQRAAATKVIGLDNFRSHDLRRTAASLMASRGVPRLTISKILNHSDTSITAVYDRHSYDPEKRAALDLWARHLTAIIEGKPTGAAVLPFAATA